MAPRIKLHDVNMAADTKTRYRLQEVETL